MTKRDARSQKKGTLLMDSIPDHAYAGLCTPLPSSPLKSPNPKKICSEMEDEAVSNADILKAINNLNDRFSKFEERVLKNTAEIAAVKENMKNLEMQCKGTDDSVKSLKDQFTTMQEKQDDAERYSRRWNLRLLNLPEKQNEDVRREVLEIITQIIPDEKNKLGFMIDTVHRVGRPRENQSTRPIIIQFTMRTFRYKVWRASLNADVMKEKQLRMAEDLTYQEKQCRNKLWPLVKQARIEGKKTRWQGPVAIIDGVRFTA
ncbi:hypothetical protein ABVT39_019867 [Epinephelus coioides]